MRRTIDCICVALLFAFGTAAVRAQTAPKTTSVPRLVKFSGTLTDGGGRPLSGVVGVTFALYEQPDGGAPIWMEVQSLQVSGNGQYAALLGSTRNDGIPAETFAAGQRWLGVQAQGQAERPRVLMTSVPYSLKSVDAETLGGLPASAFALAGTESRGPVMESVAASGKPLAAAASVTPNLSGTGTKSYIPIWNSAAALGSSKLYQTAAGSVGLGTITPGATFEAVTATATGTAVTGSATSATGVNFGVSGLTASTTGAGVLGQATAVSGANYGVYGEAASPAGIAVYGDAASGTGVAGATVSPSGYAVYGANSATTGPAYGVFGSTASTAGVGAAGTSTATSGSTVGVYGSVLSPAGIAVNGAATSGTGVAGTTTSATAYGVYGGNGGKTGNAFGVFGTTASPSGYAVYGVNSAATGPAYGVFGITASTSGIAVLGQETATSGTTYGVYGSTLSPAGVSLYGTATNGTGVAGVTASPSGDGVYGVNTATTGVSFGVYGTSASTTGYAVRGIATATSGANYGVYGGTLSPNGVGVAGSATGAGLAGQFTGNVQITGNLTVTGTVSKSGGSFRIDHPLDPEHKYLYHSFVESPDMMNIYNGVATLSRHGEAVVKLPEWFDALNRDFRYQLTCIGGFAPVYIAGEVSGNEFKIGGGRPGMKVSWQVTGIRKDAFANEHRIPVEENKPSVE